MCSLAIQIIGGEPLASFHSDAVHVCAIQWNLRCCLLSHCVSAHRFFAVCVTHCNVTILLTSPMDPNMVLLFHISNYIGFNLAVPDKHTHMRHTRWNKIRCITKKCHIFSVTKKRVDERKKKCWNYQEQKKEQQIQVNQHFVSLWACLKNSTHVSMMSNDCFIRLIYIRKKEEKQIQNAQVLTAELRYAVCSDPSCRILVASFLYQWANAAFVYIHGVYNKQQGARRYYRQKERQRKLRSWNEKANKTGDRTVCGRYERRKEKNAQRKP